MGFPRQEYWSGLPFPSPGDLPNPGIESVSPALAPPMLNVFVSICNRMLESSLLSNLLWLVDLVFPCRNSSLVLTVKFLYVFANSKKNKPINWENGKNIIILWWVKLNSQHKDVIISRNSSDKRQEALIWESKVKVSIFRNQDWRLEERIHHLIRQPYL